jgi:hypothetical protein
MSKIQYFLSWSIIVIAILMIAVTSFWLSYPYKPITFLTEPHQVKTQVVKAGDHIAFDFDYCKTMDIGAEVTISFIDGFIYNTTPVPSNIQTGCHNETMQVYVPKAIPAGEYAVGLVYKYKVNPIRTIFVNTKTEKFVVVK